MKTIVISWAVGTILRIFSNNNGACSFEQLGDVSIYPFKNILIVGKCLFSSNLMKCIWVNLQRIYERPKWDEVIVSDHKVTIIGYDNERTVNREKDYCLVNFMGSKMRKQWCR